jgi:hypothetical protein
LLQLRAKRLRKIQENGKTFFCFSEIFLKSPATMRLSHFETTPADASAIQAVTPSDIFSWPGPDVHLMGQSERTGIENNCYALTERVVVVKAETDGDLHIALSHATGDKQGIVVCEVPAKPQWCEIRNTVFSWTRTRFPFSH